MKAAVCRTFGAPLRIEQVDLDGPGPGEVRIDVAACAICHSDVSFVDGSWGGELPAIYGHEAAGTITNVGSGVTDLAVGDHVIATLIRSCGSCFYCRRGLPTFCVGTFARDELSLLHDADRVAITAGMHTAAFAEQIVVHASQVVRIPAELPLDSASLLSCGVITGVGAVRNTAQVEPGSTVVVIGIGGVGVNAIQGARLAGAEHVVAVDLLDAKLALARKFGATRTLRADQPNLDVAIRELTEQRGADYVFASVGAPSVMEQAVSLCRPGGTAVLVGIPGTGAMMTLDAVAVPNDGLRVLGSKMGQTTLARDIPTLISEYENGTLLLDELISGRWPLEQINDAIDEVRTGSPLRHVIIF